MWNKSIRSNHGEENKLKLKKTWLDKKYYFLDKYSRMDTRIAHNTAKMEKRLACGYVLPWTTPKQPKNHRWAPGWLARRKWQPKSTVLESLGENMACPVSYKSENNNF